MPRPSAIISSVGVEVECVESSKTHHSRSPCGASSRTRRTLLILLILPDVRRYDQSAGQAPACREEGGLQRLELLGRGLAEDGNPTVVGEQGDPDATELGAENAPARGREGRDAPLAK